MSNKHLMRVTDVQYEEDGGLPIVWLFGRGEDGGRVVKRVNQTEPYFFAPKEEFHPNHLKKKPVLNEKVKYVEDGWDRSGEETYRSYDGKKLVKIVTNVPSDVSDCRDIYPDTHESDLIYERRCTADYGMSGYVRVPKTMNIKPDDIESVKKDRVQDPITPRGLVADIEVNEPDEFYEDFAEDAPNQVTAITCYDNYEDVYTLFCLDPDLKVKPDEIRGYIEENWTGELEDEDPSVAADRAVNSNIKFRRFGNEEQLLQSWVDYVKERRPDYITGWNYVDFDHEYLINRIWNINDRQRENVISLHDLAEKMYVGGFKAESYIPGLPAYDMMDAYCEKLSYSDWESKSLEYVSSVELGVGKIDGSDNSYRRNRTKFMAYNIVDVQLCVELDKKKGVTDFIYMLAETCGIPMVSVGSEMKEVEGFLFKHRSKDEILPDTEDVEMDTISGGFVMPPSDGLADWVSVFDLKSLYPSSMITCNISKETMTTDPKEADVVVPDMPLNYEEVEGDSITQDDIGWELGEGSCIGFSLDEQGILPKYLGLLFERRSQKKSQRSNYEPGTSEYDRFDNQQYAIKVVMNSFFGVSDHPYFRLSEDGLGAAITSISRYVSWMGINVIENEGYKVRYGDTDSLFVSMSEQVPDSNSGKAVIEDTVEMMEELESEINSSMKKIPSVIGVPEQHPYIHKGLHGTDRHLWVYEAEKLYRRFLQTGVKKRYAGNIRWKEGDYVNKTDTVGYETEKSDSASITQDVQKEFLERVLDGQDFSELSDYIRNEIERIESDYYDLDYVAFPATLTKPLSEYGNLPKIRACEHSNKHMNHDWRDGDDPWLVYVDRTPRGVPDTDVMAVSWQRDNVPNGYEMNVDKHVEKSLEQPLSPIIGSLGYSWTEIKTGRKEQNVASSGKPSF